MENHSYSNSSYSDSRNSTPRSREIDCESQKSWNEPKVVKLMCSYGGLIQPRPHDNKLSYVGGDTKILTVGRNIGFGDFVSKLSRVCGFDKVCFKYQLPGEDLDALISVTNDEDLEHMMLEYDRSAKPARLRLFLFALMLEGNLDKGGQAVESRGSEQELTAEGLVLSQVEIQKRINELRRMQISGQEQVVNQLVSEGSEGFKVYGGGGDYFTTQRVAESVVPVQLGMPVIWQDQSQLTAVGAEQQVYVIPTPGGVYQTPTDYRQMTGHDVQAHNRVQSYYGTQRMVPDAYQDQRVYSLVPGQVMQNTQQPSISFYAEGMSGRQHTEGGYTVAYDGSGRQVYYTATAAGSGVAPTYQVVPTAGTPIQFAPASQEGNVTNPNAN